VRTRSEGLFGQVGWKLSEQWKVTAGARHSRDEKTRTGQAVINLGALVNPFIDAVLPPTPGDGHMEQSKPTYQVGLDWSATKNNFFYAKYSTGYKSGGFNSNGSGASLPYKEETVKSYELGTKNRFDGRTYQFNAALFMQDYEGYQAAQASDALNSGSGIFNVGSATIRGLEAEFIANMGGVARLDLNTTLLDANFDDNIVVRDGSRNPRDHQVGGNRLPNAPKFVLTAGIERSFDVAGGTLTPRLGAKYTSEFYYDVFNNPDSRSPGVTTLNALLTYKPPVEGWEAQVYVNNFTDRVVLARAERNYVAGANFVQFQPPRTFGARLRYHF
jgi:iron complex outermembrane receptor protein